MKSHVQMKSNSSLSFHLKNSVTEYDEINSLLFVTSPIIVDLFVTILTYKIFTDGFPLN